MNFKVTVAADYKNKIFVILLKMRVKCKWVNNKTNFI